MLSEVQLAADEKSLNNMLGYVQPNNQEQPSQKVDVLIHHYSKAYQFKPLSAQSYAYLFRKPMDLILKAW